jgi:hypothetical protein
MADTPSPRLFRRGWTFSNRGTARYSRREKNVMTSPGIPQYDRGRLLSSMRAVVPPPGSFLHHPAYGLFLFPPTALIPCQPPV